MRKVLLYCFSCLLLLKPAFGQDPVFREFEYKTGLASNIVYQIFQDSKGYMWIAHEKGLSRYNGVSYRNYFSHATKGKAVSNVLEDDEGVIYCQTYTGQQLKVQGDDLVLDSLMSTFNNYSTIKIFNKTQFLSMRNGKLHVFDKLTKKTKLLEYRGEILNGSDFLIQKDRVIFHGIKTQALYEYRGDKIRFIANFPESFQPYYMIELNGSIYFFSNSSNKKVWVYNAQKGFKSYKINADFTIQSVTVNSNKIWISTTKGVYSFDSEFTPLYSGQVFFPDANVSYTMVDREGSYWFTTLNRGIFMIPSLKIRLAEADGVGFTSLIQYKKLDIILAGTSDNSVFEYYPGSGSFVNYMKRPSPSEVKSIFFDVADDALLVGSDKFYLIKNNTVLKSTNHAIKDIESIGKGVYAFAIHNGMELFLNLDVKPDLEIIKKIAGKIPEKGTQLIQLNKSDARGRCVLFDHVRGDLYGSTANGTFRYINGQEERIMFGKQNIYASDMIVHEDYIFFATFEGRLYKYSREKGITEVTLPEIVSKNSILKITTSKNYLWMLCDNFILKLNLLDGKTEIYTTSDGLPDFEMRDICVNAGKVFIATKSGIVQFPENLESKNKYAPEIQIDRIYVNGVKSFDVFSEAKFSNDENNIQIYYDVLTYKGAPELKVFYRINNGDWLPSEKGSRLINLAALSPGKYTISLKAVNEDGVESLKESLITFSISFPYWQRWWFVLAMFTLVGWAIVTFVRYRLNVVRKEEVSKQSRIRLENELQSSILSALRVQMNPHFIFNAMNTIQSYIFQNDKVKASQYLNNFSDLIRMILDMSTRETITIDEEIKSLTLYLELEKMRFEESFTYQIVRESLNDTEMLKIPSMLIQPYVENAIKHGLFHRTGEKTLLINFSAKTNVLEVTIDDNGIGREEAMRIMSLRKSGHRSFSTSANQRRLEILNASRNQEIGVEYVDKKDIHGNATGTSVVLRVPID